MVTGCFSSINPYDEKLEAGPERAWICARVIAMGRAGVKVTVIRILTGVLELGTLVNVALSSGVVVGLVVDAGADVFEGISVGVAAERSGRPQLVSRENKSTKLKIWMCFNHKLLKYISFAKSDRQANLLL
jgi:hypothetical protein